MSTVHTNLVAAVVAVLIAAGTIVPVVSVPQADSAASAYAPELA